jgi:UDP-N-acetylmuramoyl-tripeptide--D-alanyl-D-alanine ligase
MVHAALATRMNGSAAPRSFNNHIGVPLVLLNATAKDRYVVVEAGTNAPGEIDALARIIQPDVSVITAIGLAHVEKLGSVEGIASEKAGLLRHLREGGLAIVNGDAPAIEPHLRIVPRLLRFGRGEACDLRLSGCEAAAERVRFEVNGRRWFELPGAGAHNAMNALAAIAVGRHMKLDDEAIAEGLLGYEPPPMRLNARWIGDAAYGVRLINDAYNANPESMTAALESLESITAPGSRAVAVLGDMAELGDRAPELHRALGRRLAESRLGLVVLIGRSSLYAAEVLSRSWPADRVRPIAAWTERTAEEVASLLRPGDTVLLKASRAAALERLIPAIEQRFADPTALSHRPA